MKKFWLILISAFLLAWCSLVPEQSKTPANNTSPNTSKTDTKPAKDDANTNTGQDNKDTPPEIVNPASQYCGEVGWTLKMDKMWNGSEFWVCYFQDNRQCEEWALFHGYCPKWWLKVTGYTTPAARYCGILGWDYQATDENADPEQWVCNFDNGAECDVWALYNANCRQHFNEPATSWKYQKFTGLNMLIWYPSNEVDMSEAYDPDSGKMQLLVEIIDINDLPDDPSPMGMDKPTVLAEQKALEQWNFGEEPDFLVSNSKKVIEISTWVNAKEYMVLSRFDVCDVTFERVLRFYRDDHLVKVTLSWLSSKIIDENPDFFTTDETNCWPNKMWDFQWDDQVLQDFYDKVSNHKTTGVQTNNWYNVFDLIADGIVLK